jgi:hypothetical protein
LPVIIQSFDISDGLSRIVCSRCVVFAREDPEQTTAPRGEPGKLKIDDGWPSVPCQKEIRFFGEVVVYDAETMHAPHEPGCRMKILDIRGSALLHWRAVHVGSFERALVRANKRRYTVECCAARVPPYQRAGFRANQRYLPEYVFFQ